MSEPTNERDRPEADEHRPTRRRGPYAHQIDAAAEQRERVVRTYDERGRLRGEWWPGTDAYLRVSYADDGR
jgi:hypothetical protein